MTLLHVTAGAAEPPPSVRRHLKQASATLSALEVVNRIVIRQAHHPAEAILEEGAEQDLIVLGGHGPQARSFFGRDDITIQVLARAHCPVLVVPAGG